VGYPKKMAIIILSLKYITTGFQLKSGKHIKGCKVDAVRPYFISAKKNTGLK
jgi:hypothetical protein